MHSPLETRRQLRFLFDSQKLGPLCQHLGITPENLHHLLNHRTTDFVQTHWFLEAIRESLPVEWGQTFRGQATRSLNDENKNWQLSHPSEQITYQATGSIIVGADGVFSQGMSDLL